MTSVTITPNKRLARALSAHAANDAEAAGALAWRRPTILPLGAWLRSLFEDLQVRGYEDRALLGPWAEKLLWADVVAEQLGPATRALIDLRGVSEAIRLAWRLLHEYGGAIADLNDNRTAEVDLFRACAAAFVARCDAASLFDVSRLSTRIDDALRAQRLPPPRRVVFFGFDALRPAQRRLYVTLTTLGAEVETRAAPPRRAKPRRVLIDDPTRELRAAARWAARQLEAAPDRSVALISPRLAEQRPLIVRAIEEALDPRGLLSYDDEKRGLFDVSLGEPLGAAPVVYDAICWWQLAAGRAFDLSMWVALLSSPFLYEATAEQHARARFARAIERSGRGELCLVAALEVASAARERGDFVPGAMFARLERLAERAAGLTELRLPASRWSRQLRDLLDLVGWPGERAASSIEHQAREKLDEVLDSIATLDLVRPSFLFFEIVDEIERAIDDTVFQVEAAGRARLHLLGHLEAAGQRFDSAWMLGLDAAHWPPRGEPSAYIPRALQRDRGMPHAAPDVSLAWAKALTSDLLVCADELVVSSPRHVDEIESLPSPLIVDVPPASLGELGISLEEDERGAPHSASFELVEDERGPALRLPTEVPGGSGLFADQSACPFRAFARWRLRVERATPRSALDDALMGVLIHRALERVWRVLGDHAALKSTRGARRRELVRAAAHGVIEAEAVRRPRALRPRAARLVATQVCELVEEWLELEEARPPFRVQARERPLSIEVGGLHTKVRVDRVDELPDGSQVIIDYKSGSASTRGWLADRLEEPQLPLYALAADARLAGVALAKIGYGRRKGFEGISDRGGLFGAHERSRRRAHDDTQALSALRARWRGQLAALAAEIAAGDARPLPSPSTCAHCDLSALCRKNDRHEEARE